MEMFEWGHHLPNLYLIRNWKLQNIFDFYAKSFTFDQTLQTLWSALYNMRTSEESLTFHVKTIAKMQFLQLFDAVFGAQEVW